MFYYVPIRLLLVWLLVLFVIGCTSTSIQVLKNNQSRQDNQKFFVFVATPLMPVEQVIEDRVVEVFKKNNLDAIAKYTLIPGIQNIDAQQFEQVMNQNRITQILILRPVGETQNSPEVSLALPASAFGLYNREATNLYESSDTWSRRNRHIYAQIIDLKEQKITWYALITSKLWTTTEVDLYKNSLSTVASDIAVSIVGSIGQH